MLFLSLLLFLFSQVIYTIEMTPSLNNVCQENTRNRNKTLKFRMYFIRNTLYIQEGTNVCFTRFLSFSISYL
ncbi:hypothetical protein LEP1GSC062_1016 [Leptospira alexanderi serovar Manhao 3 str. L 60]|uniref:Uncharacterized protein n=1 Tax=Leptospira alexanderi serovar Manhao 3 str. L 60 TaxID=1049759 RepID=V6HZI5_9LEPT|nr:hypothetical protein LEP1GSC062_1016 [Leptospira alexanderi serovar Manhao 3 str. L 60]